MKYPVLVLIIVIKNCKIPSNIYLLQLVKYLTYVTIIAVLNTKYYLSICSKHKVKSFISVQEREREAVTPPFLKIKIFINDLSLGLSGKGINQRSRCNEEQKSFSYLC